LSASQDSFGKERKKLVVESLGSIISLAAFIIITIASQKAIEEGLNITGKSSWVLAACVAALAIGGMMQPANREPAEKDARDFILLPYALYGLACLLAMLLGLLFRNPKRKDRILRWFKKCRSDLNDRMKR
jgi:ABC-type uncharacterized transport system permease subunit